MVSGQSAKPASEPTEGTQKIDPVTEVISTNFNPSRPIHRKREDE
jgi:hypothetical protein